MRVVLATSLLFLFSCNPEVEIPAYLYVEKADFIAANFEQEGTSSSKITNIRVRVNGQTIGSFSLPALVPVIANGNTDIAIDAGIKLNGLSQQRPEYPFYTPYETRINLTKGKIDTIVSVFNYVDYIKFALKEDFESAGLKFSSVSESKVLEKTQESSLLFHYPNEPNNFSGIIQLPFQDTINFFEIKTTDPIYLDATSTTVCFVEMNYRFEENVEIGIYAYSSSSAYSNRQYSICNIIGTPDSEWGKIYINLTDVMLDATVNMTMSHFDIYLKCGISSNKTARFLFDNIKVIYY